MTFHWHCPNDTCATFGDDITGPIDFPEVMCGTCGTVLTRDEPTDDADAG